MPPRTPQRRPVARPRGYDPTVSIATASAAKVGQENPQVQPQPAQEQKANDDLKKLIETLKNKIGTNPNTPAQKQVPPAPKSRGTWERSITNKEKTWAPRPAYTILTRVSNHEKVPLKSTRSQELTINALPHSFLYKPGIDGIKVDKLTVKAGKQLGFC